MDRLSILAIKIAWSVYWRITLGGLYGPEFSPNIPTALIAGPSLWQSENRSPPLLRYANNLTAVTPSTLASAENRPLPVRSVALAKHEPCDSEIECDRQSSTIPEFATLLQNGPRLANKFGTTSRKSQIPQAALNSLIRPGHHGSLRKSSPNSYRNSFRKFLKAKMSLQ